MDGGMSFDNNPAEHEMKRVPLGTKS
ncbi:MAG: hypothetical protein J0M35_12300 [Candidatus Obscuribacter phosphatis]|uniref:Uncharacterized protein n=1 Tax=Candidatus Obscuribacter phosphatis TaxID=1906157 RepID=A0A8J7P7V2_9BACT|nr:hypothetical protein [Candidatus Obscuribacter phosphatis]